ncbi:hypothetical protein VP217E381_P0025 [Vibrio phage 217E38-1]|nr:hypothetical protein VP217E381_P0025 [Vibrio phage 217E38-1]
MGIGADLLTHKHTYIGGSCHRWSKSDLSV